MSSSHFLPQNLKVLRKRMRYSQEELALALGVNRTSLSSYENGLAEPSLTVLMKIASQCKVNLDALIRQDLSSLPESKLVEMNLEQQIDVSGRTLRVLTTTVSPDNSDNIELVPVKAKAGYTTGYADPDFINVLQTFTLPFLNPNRKYRTFQISGDSMPPVSDGAWVTGEYIQDWGIIRDHHPYIIVTKEEGVVFKVAFNRIRERGSLLLCSTNPAYEPFEVQVEDVLEVWRFVNYINHELPEASLKRDEISDTVLTLQRELTELKNTFKAERKQPKVAA